MEEKNPKGMTILFSNKEFIDDLTNEIAGELFKALFTYCENDYDRNGIELSDKCEEMIFKIITQQLADFRENYRKKCERNADNAKKRWEKTDESGGRPITATSSTRGAVQQYTDLKRNEKLNQLNQYR